jgi:hypothetical protein
LEQADPGRFITPMIDWWFPPSSSFIFVVFFHDYYSLKLQRNRD